MTRKEAAAQITAVRRRCRGPLAADAARVVKALREEGRIEDAQRADAAGRKGCGFDFNAIVIAGPLDGEQHAYECPQCGVEGTYTAPRFELDAE